MHPKTFVPTTEPMFFKSFKELPAKIDEETGIAD